LNPAPAVYGNEAKLLSLLNHDNRTDDEAIVETSPLVPVKAKPWDRLDMKSEELKVDEAVENKPFEKPIVVLVALYEVAPVNGKAAEVMVIGDAPITVNGEQLVPLVHVAEVVATLANVFAPEKYARLDTTAADEVESPSNESAFPVSLIGNVVESVPCFPFSVVWRSVPARETVPKKAFVADA
jgi:hypothetical protein